LFNICAQSKRFPGRRISPYFYHSGKLAFSTRSPLPSGNDRYLRAP
jgi:hypothetical protein